MMIANYSLFAQNSQADSLYDLLEHRPNHDSLRAKILFQICFAEYETHPEKSKELALELLQLSREIGFVKGESVGFRYLTEYYLSNGNHAEALKNAYKMLRTAEASHYKKNIGRAYQMFADVAEREKNYESAKKNYLEAIRRFKEAGFTLDEGSTYNNLAGLYFSFGKIDSAIAIHAKAIQIMLDANDENGLGLVYGNLGEIYLAKKDDNGALDLFEKALAIDERLNNQYRMATRLAGIADVYRHRGQFDKASSYLQRSLTAAKAIQNKSVLKETYHSMMLLSTSQGDLKSALSYRETESLYQDSIYTEEKAIQLVEAETRYKSAKKDQAIQLLQRDKKISELWRNIFISAFVLLAALSSVIYITLRNRERLNRKILNLQIDRLVAQHAELSARIRNAVPVTEDIPESQDQQLMKKAIEVIETNLSDRLFGVDEIADALGMSRASLTRKLKIITGFPPGELIRNIRLRRAALLIEYDSDSISQVAFSVGFEDQSYFSKSFKKQFGVTPSEFAKNKKVSI